MGPSTIQGIEERGAARELLTREKLGAAWPQTAASSLHTEPSILSAHAQSRRHPLPYSTTGKRLEDDFSGSLSLKSR